MAGPQNKSGEATVSRTENTNATVVTGQTQKESSLYVGSDDLSSAKVTLKNTPSSCIHTEVNEYWSLYSNKPVFGISKTQICMIFIIWLENCSHCGKRKVDKEITL